MEPGIIITDMSNHLPSICHLQQTKHVCKEPLKFKTRQMTEDKLNKIKNILSDTLWHNNILNELDPNTTFNNLTTTIQQTIELVAHEHVVTISAKKRFTLPWMTKGLIKSCQTKLNYYKNALLPKCPETEHEKYNLVKFWNC